MAQFEKQTCRPREHLRAAGSLYPAAWKQADEFRADRGTGGLPEWPTWCYLPMAAWYAIVSAAARTDRLGPQHMHLATDIGRLGALGAWRCTQGIYRFDPALYDAVRCTPVDGDLPHDVLYHLPEWCVYIETPGMLFGPAVLHGVFAHLEWDAATGGRPELRLLLDSEGALTPLPLHLGEWSLAESIDRMLKESAVQAVIAGVAPMPGQAEGAALLREQIEPVISLLLYLCSQAAEIGNGDKLPTNPEPKRTKRGWRLFPPDKPTTWDVGVRLGAALRAAYHSNETGAGTHSGPRAHVRRAHWHGYWTGPKNSPAERKIQIKWLSPILVNVDPDTYLPAVVRPVNVDSPKTRNER